MAKYTQDQDAVVRGRRLSLGAALLGFVIAALCVDAGFWAAMTGAHQLAEVLHVAVIVSGIFVVSMFLASVVFHTLRIVRWRT